LSALTLFSLLETLACPKYLSYLLLNQTNQAYYYHLIFSI
jgi:hypothetical protein